MSVRAELSLQLRPHPPPQHDKVIFLAASAWGWGVGMGVHTEREKELASRSKSPHLGKKSTDEVRVGPRRGTRGVDRTRNAGQLQEREPVLSSS